jgi:hypothetical protein
MENFKLINFVQDILDREIIKINITDTSYETTFKKTAYYIKIIDIEGERCYLYNVNQSMMVEVNSNLCSFTIKETRIPLGLTATLYTTLIEVNKHI